MGIRVLVIRQPLKGGGEALMISDLPAIVGRSINLRHNRDLSVDPWDQPILYPLSIFFITR
jgi:hypothetical protein